jgi:hypothetical protein
MFLSGLIFAELGINDEKSDRSVDNVSPWPALLCDQSTMSDPVPHLEVINRHCQTCFLEQSFNFFYPNPLFQIDHSTLLKDR